MIDRLSNFDLSSQLDKNTLDLQSLQATIDDLKNIYSGHQEELDEAMRELQKILEEQHQLVANATDASIKGLQAEIGHLGEDHLIPDLKRDSKHPLVGFKGANDNANADGNDWYKKFRDNMDISDAKNDIF